MTKKSYDRIISWFSERPRLVKLMKALNGGLPLAMSVAYPLLLALLAVTHDGRLWRVLIVPAFVFTAVTVLRRRLDFERPYEKLGITPLITREGGGKSFPSRHAASAVVIAAAFWYIAPPAGAVLSAAALLITVIRPLAGLHFPRDTAAGAALGILAALAGFRLIP